ncbi:CRISPR-associated endonuclease Cas2 [Mycoplasmoides fastidiosum]|nr:CRISPR-associated endonuclease Cas2 [Mycoplasmoides fastidiosum]UUD38117.1 CRISPR-associated endonuclease Cas2 [Mycoplasmoides fastidiosum]
MRLMLFYDLPTETEEDRKRYSKFHKWIVKKGYLMLQFSVYYKTIPSSQKYPIELQAIKNNLPKRGNIRLLMVSETQFFNMKVLTGQQTINEKYNGMERYVRIEDDIEDE